VGVLVPAVWHGLPHSGQRGGGSRHPGRDPQSRGSRPGV